MISDEAFEHAVEEESYFVSMTDMMVGMIFIFIILLMYYVLQFSTTISRFEDVNQARAKIAVELKEELERRGVAVTIEENSSVLRLKDNVLFDSGQPDVKLEGRPKVVSLAESLRAVLPCYTDPSLAATRSTRDWGVRDLERSRRTIRPTIMALSLAAPTSGPSISSVSRPTGLGP
ncbi:hypothetical protein [Caulobacter sp. CCG-8]|uniref:hypothetical protein n=1 Tax=Caulobacter sp. CCG-8 TaxID=3127958 RepID=UPI00307E8A58